LPNFDKMQTLLELPAGEVAEIIGIAGGWGIQRNLAALGIIPGRKIKKVIVQPMGGPVIVEIVGGTTVAIGRGMAMKIFVRRGES